MPKRAGSRRRNSRKSSRRNSRKSSRKSSRRNSRKSSRKNSRKSSRKSSRKISRKSSRRRNKQRGGNLSDRIAKQLPNNLVKKYYELNRELRTLIAQEKKNKDEEDRITEIRNEMETIKEQLTDMGYAHLLLRT